MELRLEGKNSVWIKYSGFQEDFRLLPSFINFLNDIEPSLFWDLRGVTGHENEQDEIEELKEQQFERFQSKVENSRENMEEVLLKLRWMLEKIIDPEESIVDSLLPGKDFYFVIGFMRSGGTYLTKELLRSTGRDIQNYLPGMIHDGCPWWPTCQHWRDDSEKKLQLYFELAQYLYWIEQTHEKDQKIIKKRIVFADCLPVIDAVFEDQAHYIFTTRHPMTSAESFISMEAQDYGIPITDQRYNHEGWYKTVSRHFDYTDEEWDGFDYYQQFLLRWTTYYLQIGLDLRPLKGEITSLGFSQGYERFLKSFASDGDGYTPDPFDPKERTSGQLPESKIRQSIDLIDSAWNETSHDFPEIKEA